MILATLILAQAAVSTPGPLTWNNITLGASASSLRSYFGDPLRVVIFDNGTRRIARYWLAGSDSTYVLVIEERGYINGLEIFTNAATTGIIASVPPDPLGVRLGETADSVKSKAPMLHASAGDDGTPMLIGRVSATAGAAYSFQNNRVSNIHWATSIRHEGADQAPLADPAGDSISTAVLDKQGNEADGVAWEYQYLAFHPCSDNARWQLRQQSVMNQGGREYDRLHVVCPTTTAERDFYFDITSYYGKL